jgi:hypothetical protein
LFGGQEENISEENYNKTFSFSQKNKSNLVDNTPLAQSLNFSQMKNPALHKPLS